VSGLEQLGFDSPQIQRFLSLLHHSNRFGDPPNLVFNGCRGSELAANVNLVLNLRMHEDQQQQQQQQQQPASLTSQ
jgi:hypothetical protein